jgi:hypothetical protein
MVFSETILPAGKILYKGLKGVTCQTLLRDTRAFYLTENPNTAKDYGVSCKYRLKKTIRLFNLSHKNISELLKSKYPISEKTKHLLRTALGTGVTVGQQVRAARALFGKDAGRLPRPTNKRLGQRLSYTELNKLAFGNFTREFLIPEGYDGYYAAKKKTTFHGGVFHSEIMINNAYQTIERVSGSARMPVATTRSIKWARPRLFMEFSKGTKRLVRPYGGGLTIFCTGGMAIRLYLQKRKQQLPPKIRKTADFDFTFGLPHKLTSDTEVATYVYSMRKIMTDHLNDFVMYLNRHYKGVNARLKVNNFSRSPYDNPRVQVPATGRKIYQVISYQIITGNNDVTDIVDTALAVYPGASRHMLHLPFSTKIGIPIQRLRYQLKDSLALLSGSFVYKGLISHRNPISGKVKEKGLKNTERTKKLLELIGKRRTYYKNLIPIGAKAIPLVEAVVKKNARAAHRAARVVNRVLKKIK